MGVSTDGQINFGIPFEEGYEFPWMSEKWDGDWEEWWLCEICGYEPEFEIYDESGNYIDGEKPPDDTVSEYFDQKRRFALLHPMPVSFENYCSDDCPMYMVVLSDKALSNSRGYPETFDPTELSVTDNERKVLIDFCKKYCTGGEYDEMPELNPKWYLSSYWG